MVLLSNNPDFSERELESAAQYMRNNNVTLISRSLRTVLSCFDDLDVNQFELQTDYLISFISNGVNQDATFVRRPVSMLWPDNYHDMCNQMAHLDGYLMNTEFREKPVDWMLKTGLTFVPNCRQCKSKMDLYYEQNTVKWQCQKTQACRLYFMPVQRPSFFSNFERVGLDKLLFSIYFWSICTPVEDVHKPMKLDPMILDNIWTRIQNVCRTALEKSYPRHRLSNIVNPDNPEEPTKPIDLVSIKLNDLYIVCAKHPHSNNVRLGLWIPQVSTYSFAQLTESWFAHGANVRVGELKFMSLTKHRTDLNVELVPRLHMINKDGHFDRQSAFGYLICQLTHIFKDINSTTITRWRVKLLLAEMEWRELYGTNPYDAFTNIINHMVQYGDSSNCYSEPTLPTQYEESYDNQDLRPSETDYIWTEKYFYATIDPVDSEGKVIARFLEPVNHEEPPYADVRLTCHFCRMVYESFDFSMHMISHVERNRKEFDRKEYLIKNIIECKHCFKTFGRDTLAVHSGLFRTDLQLIQYGCRICCVKFEDRSSFLQHMRQAHFQHEAPYRCPSCPFASSFQRDVFIHFQEEHRHSMIVMCPLCLRSFTVLRPDKMNEDKMAQLSKIVYNHIAEHYVISKGYSCSNCCLCFLDRDSLKRHKQSHHNPMEIHDTSKVIIQPFIVTKAEERFCVKAIPIELFIANKRPNYIPVPTARSITTSNLDILSTSKSREDSGNGGFDSDDSDRSDGSGAKYDATNDNTNEAGSPPAASNTEEPRHSSTSSGITSLGDSDDDTSSHSSSDCDSYMTACEIGTIYVRGLGSGAENLLKGGEPTLKVPTNKTAAQFKDMKHDELTSERLISYLSKMKRADGVVPNRSVILTPGGKPAQCCECMHYVTVDHFVAKIKCPKAKCRYLTHCPRAAMRHRRTYHEQRTTNHESIVGAASSDD